METPALFTHVSKFPKWVIASDAIFLTSPSSPTSAVTVIARVPFVFRLGSGIVPKRGTVFQDGDLIYAAVADARLAEVEAILAAPPKEH